MVDACVQAEIPVSVWTVDDVGVARSLIRAGVTGFFTNDPETLYAAF
jgi:glycerophosphoryl diester phosphodiesterase